MLEWYFGKFTKLLAYSVLCYVLQVLVRSAGRRRHDSYTHMEFYVIRFWEMFCGTEL